MIRCSFSIVKYPTTSADILNHDLQNITDELSARMLSLCDESIVLPLRLIFSNILSTGVYPDIWKQANVTPVHKKGSKQLVSNYIPISLLPICGKLFERIVFKYTYNHPISNNLITMNQSGYRPGDSTINQLIELVNVIHPLINANLQRFVQYFLIYQKRSIRFGTKVCYSNLSKMVYRVLSFYYCKIILQTGSNVLS